MGRWQQHRGYIEGVRNSSAVGVRHRGGQCAATQTNQGFKRMPAPRKNGQTGCEACKGCQGIEITRRNEEADAEAGRALLWQRSFEKGIVASEGDFAPMFGHFNLIHSSAGPNTSKRLQLGFQPWAVKVFENYCWFKLSVKRGEVTSERLALGEEE